MPSQRVLAASLKRSQATTRLLIAVRRAERPVRTPPPEPPRLPQAQMCDLVPAQTVVVDLGAQIAPDRTIALDADAGWPHRLVLATSPDNLRTE